MPRCTLLLVIFCILHFTTSLDSPFRRCKPKNRPCLISNVQDAITRMLPGIPELGLPPIEPIYAEQMNISGGSGAVKVDQYYKDTNLWGYSTAEVMDIAVDLEKMTIVMEIPMRNCSMAAEYNFNGRILLLPIRGNGASMISMLEVNVTHSLKLGSYDKDGETHLTVADYKLKLKPGLVTYYFGNLFNGDKILGEAMLKVMNDNWLEIFKDVAHGYESAYGLIYKQYAERIFQKIPLSQLFDMDQE